MTARAVLSPGGSRAGTSVPGGLLVALAVAAALELLVLRSFTRTAIHIPALEELAGPYRVITFAGQFDYYVAVILLGIALPALALVLGRRCGLPGVVAAMAVGLFGASAVLARADAASARTVTGLTMASVVVLAAVLATIAPRRGAWALLFAVAFALAGASAGGSSPRTGEALWLAEVLAVMAGVLAPLAFTIRGDRRVAVIGLSVAAVVTLMVLGGTTTTKILMLWNFGLTGVLPAVAYAGAAGAVTAAMVSLARRGERMAAVGVLLMLVGGIGLHSTYQTGLVVAGLATLCAAAPVAALPSAGRVTRKDDAEELVTA